jgi:hypothetical protein
MGAAAAEALATPSELTPIAMPPVPRRDWVTPPITALDARSMT